jgi:hypothetical protein
MKWTLWLGVAILVLTVVVLLTKKKKSCYAPPRDENTIPPYIEPSSNAVAQDSQTEVFKDASGWLNMRENPMSAFIQEDAFSNVSGISGFGSFVGLESSAGIAPMTVIQSTGTVKDAFVPENPEVMSTIAVGQQASSTSQARAQ